MTKFTPKQQKYLSCLNKRLAKVEAEKKLLDKQQIDAAKLADKYVDIVEYLEDKATDAYWKIVDLEDEIEAFQRTPDAFA